MTIAHLLTSFSHHSGPFSNEGDDGVLKESERLEAFENGYASGWEDAQKALEESTQVISQEFGKSLKDLSFSYHEAVAQVQKSIAPLLRTIFEKTLPDQVNTGFGTFLIEHIQKTLADQSDKQPITVTVGVDRVGMLQDLVEQETSLNIVVKSDPSFDNLTAEIGFEDFAQDIDLGAVLHEMQQNIEAFIQHNEQEVA